ncbi:MAG TPA: c-type cytochrome [Terriglobales bacterium]|nr:c-type cytochrome [Terriglobales bacterium]
MPRLNGATLLTSLVLSGALLLSAACKVAPPGRIETAVATDVKRYVTVSGKGDHNPLAGNSADIASGRKAFGSYCIVCHGLDGQNTGVPFADRMAPPVPSLASDSVQKYSDGQLHSIIQNGIYPSGMPAAKGILNDDEIWAIVTYLRHLPPKGSLGEPKVYSGE